MQSHGYFIPDGEPPPHLPDNARWVTARFGFEVTGAVSGDGVEVPAASDIRVVTVVATDGAALRELIYDKVREILSVTPNARHEARREKGLP